MTRRWKTASILLAAGATAGGALLFAREKPEVGAPQPEARAARGQDTPVLEVRPGLLKVVVIEPGSLEVSRAQDVYCQAEGPTTIIKIVPEGQRVKKGDIICELDSAALKDQLVNQRIKTQYAEGNYLNAKAAREVAEMAAKEYRDGNYPQNRAAIQEELRLAAAEQSHAQDELDRMMRALQRLNGFLTAKGEDRTAVDIAAETYINDRVHGAEMAVRRAQSLMGQAHAKEDLLKYTAPKRIKELESEVRKAQTDELAKQATWELEKSKLDRLEKQVGHCTLVAPIDGVVAYANDPSRIWGSNRSQIEEGATVRERQKIFSLPDFEGPWQVNAKVRELIVARVAPGQRVRVRIVGLPEETLAGVVVEVAPLPDASTYFQSDPKVYTTRIRLEKKLPGLRPGLSAQVEMALTDLDRVLSVPWQAVLEHKDKDFVYLITPEGPVQREVRLGLFNDTLIEVKDGLREGDRVALDPVWLLSEAELREAFAVSKEARAHEAAAAARAASAGPAPAIDPGARARMFGKLRNLAPADLGKLKSAGDDERRAILKKGGLTDAELRAFEQMRKPDPRASGPGSPRRGGDRP